jgi:L-ascorbate 6-phosphate lactonase
MKSVKDSILNAPLGKTWLFWMGQAGFIIKSAEGRLLGIDLYLSECVEPVEGHVGYHRLMPQIVDPIELGLDVIIATHFHRDHFDIDAMPQMMANGKTQLFCAYDCQDDVENLKIDKKKVQYVRPGESYDFAEFHIDFVNSDHGAGAPLEAAPIITVDGKHILEAGDTSLHLDWKDEYLKAGALDVLIAPINGAYGNLNEQENVNLTKALKPNLTVPCHFGMFASHGGNPGLWKELIEQQLPGQAYKLFTMGEGIEL